MPEYRMLSEKSLVEQWMLDVTLAVCRLCLTMFDIFHVFSYFDVLIFSTSLFNGLAAE